jgi:hypothetical protein
VLGCDGPGTESFGPEGKQGHTSEIGQGRAMCRSQRLFRSDVQWTLADRRMQSRAGFGLLGGAYQW